MRLHLSRLILVLLFAAVGIPAMAQRGSVSGTLKDTVYVEILSNATVTVKKAVDSSVVTYSLTNDEGVFNIKGLEIGKYIIQISYQSYKPYVKPFEITNEALDVKLGQVHLDKVSDELDLVVVEAPPISVKKDTVEFRADAFKTAPNSTAEDVLKRVPGMTVNADGTITAQGEEVTKIYVNGKEYFGNDPKMATKNITADMIESLQMYDDMSDQAKFTRIDDGSRTRTINIKLKKGMDKGYFGRVIAGYGTDDRYETSVLLNMFNGDRRISLLGGSNNINKQNFSFSEIMGGSGGGMGGMGGGGNRGGGGMGGVMRVGGGMGGFGGGQAGVNRNSNIGLNFTDKWGSKIDVTGSYFYSNSKSINEQESFRTTEYKADSVYLQDSRSASNSLNENHRFNLRLEYYIDSFNSILYTPTVTLQNSESFSQDTSVTFFRGNGQNLMTNTSNRVNTSNRDGYNINNNLLYRRKFRKEGRTFTLRWQQSLNDGDNYSLLIAPIYNLDQSGNTTNIIRQDVERFQKTKTTSNTYAASFTEAIAANKMLEFNYSYTDRNNTSDSRAFNYSASGKYDEVNKQQTNFFDNSTNTHSGGANFRVVQTKYNFQFGTALESTKMTSRSVRALTNLDTTLTHNFLNIAPNASFNYQFSRQKNLRFFYRGRTNQPSITQLQDAPDYSNVMRISNGNPNLKQEFSNNFNLNYNTFNSNTFSFFNMGVRGQYTNNKIVNSITAPPEHILETTQVVGGAEYVVPVNMNGIYSASANFTWGMPLRGALRGSNFSLSNFTNYNHNKSLLRGQENVAKTLGITQSANISMDIKSKLNILLNASLTFNSINYTVTPNNNERYYTQVYRTEATYQFLKRMVLASDFNYLVNTGRAEGFNQSIPVWNASMAVQVFPKKNGEIKFSVRDIMNQNQSITRTQADNYFIDTRSVVLKRYFMLTFTYNLNKAGDRGAQQNNQNRFGPGNMRGGMPGGMPGGMQGGMHGGMGRPGGNFAPGTPGASMNVPY